MLHDLTPLVFVVHIAGGTIGLVAGSIAIFAAKGGWLHRRAGTVFVVAMLTMAVFADVLAVVMPGQIVNLVIGSFAFYLVATAWLAVSRAEATTGWPERIALAAVFCLCVPFVLLTFQLLTGATPFLKSAFEFKGPIRIAIFSFTFVAVVAAIADVRVMLAGGLVGVARIARHLWRMCLGLTLAVGSAFTNGLPRMLPGPYHVPAALFFPQFIPLGLLVFWLIRVHLPGWRPAPGRAVALHQP